MTIGNYGTVLADMEIRRGQDFVHVFEFVGGELDLASTAVFEVYGRDRETLLGVWPAAELDATTVKVQILAPLVDAMPNGSFYTLYVQEPGYPRVATHEGPVWRKGRA
ncbi:MAG: hypothetical protein M0Q49_04575 [Porticoccaceae bacterium]|nr:hypothetical protein [Porticoccaceae bacterium]